MPDQPLRVIGLSISPYSLKVRAYLRRLLREYVNYYNAERVHTSIADAPEGRPVEIRPSTDAKVIGFPRVGGLHHRYAWREAS